MEQESLWIHIPTPTPASACVYEDQLNWALFRAKDPTTLQGSSQVPFGDATCMAPLSSQSCPQLPNLHLKLAVLVSPAETVRCPCG